MNPNARLGCLCIVSLLCIRATHVRAQAAAEPEPSSVTAVTPEVQIRLREEFLGHPYRGTPGSYSLATRYRARAGVTYEHAALTVRIQVQAIGVFGEELPTSSESALGLHQGYFQLTQGSYWLRVGRQEMSYGEGRMIGTLDWMMSARKFDAVRAHAETQNWVVDAFAAVTRAQGDYATCPADNDVSACTVSHSSGDYMGGVYSTWRKDETLSLDLYTLFRHDGASASDVLRDRNIVSPGVRATGELRETVRYRAEGIVQLGQIQGSTATKRQHRAAAALGEVGLELDREARAVVALGGAYATGETKNGSSEFDNFFPANHKIYGVADLFGLRNLQQEYLSLHWSVPERKLQGFLMAHALGLATAQGRWTNAPGDSITNDPVAPGRGRFLGTSWDAVVRYTPTANVWIEAGYSLFAPTDNAARFGKTEAQHFAYLWTEAKLP